MKATFKFATLALDLTGISAIAGLRAATASALPVVAAELLHQPGLTWMGIAAFWACLADNGGSMRTRLSAMSGVTLLGAIACGIAALLAGTGLVWLAVLTAALVSFGGSFARIFGATATGIGLLVTVTILVALGLPPQPIGQVPAFAALYFAGGVWATLLTLVIWRVYPYQPDATRSPFALPRSPIWRAASGSSITPPLPGIRRGTGWHSSAGDRAATRSRRRAACSPICGAAAAARATAARG